MAPTSLCKLRPRNVQYQAPVKHTHSFAIMIIIIIIYCFCDSYYYYHYYYYEYNLSLLSLSLLLSLFFLIIVIITCRSNSDREYANPRLYDSKPAPRPLAQTYGWPIADDHAEGARVAEWERNGERNFRCTIGRKFGCNVLQYAKTCKHECATMCNNVRQCAIMCKHMQTHVAALGLAVFCILQKCAITSQQQQPPPAR